MATQPAQAFKSENTRDGHATEVEVNFAEAEFLIKMKWPGNPEGS